MPCVPAIRLRGAGAGEQGLISATKSVEYITRAGLSALIRGPKAVRTGPFQRDGISVRDDHFRSSVADLHYCGDSVFGSLRVSMDAPWDSSAGRPRHPRWRGLSVLDSLRARGPPRGPGNALNITAAHCPMRRKDIGLPHGTATTRASKAITFHAPNMMRAMAIAITTSLMSALRLRALRLAERSAFETISRALAAALRSAAARSRSGARRFGPIAANYLHSRPPAKLFQPRCVRRTKRGFLLCPRVNDSSE